MSENFEKTEEQDIIREFSPKQKKRSFWRRFAFGSWIFALVAVLLVLGGSLVYKTGFTFSQMQTGKEDLTFLLGDDNMATPTPESDRLNILLLGLRGEGDPNGGLLTDSIMILSYKKSTGQVALISLPRDLYVMMPGQKYKEKINFAYALGFEKKGSAGALLYSRVAVSQATGLYFDYAVSIDHKALKEIVDILGGVNITLEKPFTETQQWTRGGDTGSSPYFFIRNETTQASSSAASGEKEVSQKWVFEIPAGTSHLDGETALYFVRARYSSSDFDRVRRQQILLSAVKDKAFSLGFFANPVKIYQVLETLGSNVRTNIPLGEIPGLISLAQKINSKDVIHKVFDTTPEGLLYSTKNEAGAYILLPQGDDFSKIKEACRDIFNVASPAGQQN